MSFWKLILRSLRFHARSHLGTLLGATVGSAVLIGALAVGDSVRGSLRELALVRLGKTEFVVGGNDRFFRAELGRELQAELQSKTAVALQLAGTATNPETSARANRVQVLGVEKEFWGLAQKPAPGDLDAETVLLNSRLAEQIKAKAGDSILLRIHKPSLLSREAPISPQEDISLAVRLQVGAVLSDEHFGRFSLQASQLPPFNAFVSLQLLQQKLELNGRANLLLVERNENQGLDRNEALRKRFQLADAELELRELPAGNLELRTPRVFLDFPVVQTATNLPGAQPVLTYFVNELSANGNSTPYSMVAASKAPLVPGDLRDDEIIINEWLAGDLRAEVGDELRLRYFVLGETKRLEERTNSFRIRAVVPMSTLDRELMPEFPGLAKAEETQDWDAGFPIDMKRIRPKDEQYWKQFRGTPKALVTLNAGQRMWSNRFGNLTAVRFSNSNSAEIEFALKRNVNPGSLGLSFQPVRQQALAAGSQAQDFGQLFLGFSFFLIVAALLLMALLFQFSLERRATETGTLLALGFTHKQVRKILLLEGAALALLGGILGAAAGILYAKAMLAGLRTIWQSAVGTSALNFHLTTTTLLVSVFASVLVCVLTIWLALRNQTKRSARELLARGAELESQISNSSSKGRGLSKSICVLSGLAGAALVLWAISQKDTAAAGAFFGGGTLLLISGLAGVATLLRNQQSAADLQSAGAKGKSPARPHPQLTFASLIIRGCARRRKRSLATIAMLACGSFLIVAVGANKLDAQRDSHKRSSGTGGFALIGETTLAVVHNLNEPSGLEFFGLDQKPLAGASFVPLRVREGDDASCLNLNRAQTPRLLGVKPELLNLRRSFSLARVEDGFAKSELWLLLKSAEFSRTQLQENEIPAIGDEASIRWALGKKVGDLIEYTDERGRVFKLRLVASLANSILQGSLLIDEAEFLKRFPSESGYRMFLVDAPSETVAQVSATLSRAMQHVGLELIPATERLAQFNAVQNTYLNTFQVLGGLGLLLGSAGLGVVVLRNVLERRGELALLLAVGFRRRALRKLVLAEHGVLLLLGLAIGTVAAVLAVLPALLSPGAEIPYASLAVTLAAVLLNGFFWTWLAARVALRGELLETLRNN